MGNSMTQEEIEQLPYYFDKIMNIPCPELDIGDKMGSTGYIDFINPQDVSGALMKGVDCYSREFIVWKAQVTINKPDGSSNNYNTFTTFFKRYPDLSSRVYHTCGHYGKNLFNTHGGANLKQMEFLYKFLSDGYAELDLTQADSIKLAYPYENDDIWNNKTDGWVFKIKLVDKLESL
jgi:hypothetical protein